MAPFHPLRYETRALVARALAAFAVFCAFLVLLAGSGPVHIASAEAKKDKGAADGTNVVLQDGQTAQPAPTGNGNDNGNGTDSGNGTGHENGNTGNGNGNGWGKGGAD